MSTTEFYLTQWEETGTSHDQQIARESIQQFRRFARIFDVGKPAAATFEGWYHALDGKSGKANRLFAKGIQLAQQYHMPYDEGVAHLLWGRFIQDAASEQQHHFEAATAIFDRLGADYDLKRVPAAK